MLETLLNSVFSTAKGCWTGHLKKVEVEAGAGVEVEAHAVGNQVCQVKDRTTVNATAFPFSALNNSPLLLVSPSEILLPTQE